MRFELPFEAVESITLASLQDHYNMTKESLDEFYEGKSWMHRDDIEGQAILMYHLKEVIEYYGGSV